MHEHRRWTTPPHPTAPPRRITSPRPIAWLCRAARLHPTPRLGPATRPAANDAAPPVHRHHRAAPLRPTAPLRRAAAAHRATLLGPAAPLRWKARLHRAAPLRRSAGLGPSWRLAAVAALAWVGLVGSVGGCGGGSTEPAVVDDAWAVPVGDGDAAVVYATITASTADELTGAHVDRDIARRAGVVNPEDASAEPGHLGHLDPGGSLNDDQHHTIALRPDTPVALEPGRAHLALDLLTTPLQPGDTFEITFTFDESPDVRTRVTVRPESP